MVRHEDASTSCSAWKILGASPLIELASAPDVCNAACISTCECDPAVLGGQLSSEYVQEFVAS